MPDYGLGATPANEILLAGGNLEYEVVITGEISSGTFTSVGYTDKEAGASLLVGAPEFRDVMVTGLDDPVKRKAGKRSVTFKCTLLQMRLENLAIAFGDKPADVAAGVYKGGKSEQAEVLKFRYTVLNVDDSTKDKRLYLMRGRLIEAVEVPFGDNKESAVQITITAEEVLGTESPAITHDGAALTGFRFVLLEGDFSA